eukprot:Lankesteria_metandrocarpae@DN6635_c0_g1_i1.p1
MVTNPWINLYEMLTEPKLQLIDSVTLREEVKRCKEYPHGRYPYELHTAHLCEVPGSFICALNHYLQTMKKRNEGTEDCLWSYIQWNWKAMLLNPFYEGNEGSAMINDDIFYQHTVDNWLRGVDNSGSILSRANIESYINSCHGTCMLVTADASVDCQFDANRQEKTTSRLNFTQLVCAMGMLKQKGTFLMKMFTMFESQSLSILTIIAMHFEELYFV